jgi:hypothetical protein
LFGLLCDPINDGDNTVSCNPQDVGIPNRKTPDIDASYEEELIDIRYDVNPMNDY